jgi:hypothetical protein
MAAKGVAYWRREVPAFDKANRAIDLLIAADLGWAHGQSVIAHIHPDTLAVSILLRGAGSQALVAKADERLSKLGYRKGGWVHENTFGVEVWRKDVTR